MIKGEQGKDEKNEKKEESIANSYLMVNDDEVNINNSFNFTFDELLEVFNDLIDEFKILRLKNE